MSDEIKCKIRGNMLTVEMSEEDANVFFRLGLQGLVDQIVGKNKYVVVLPDHVKKEKTDKVIDLTDRQSEFLIQEGILLAIREGIEKQEKENSMSKGPKMTKVKNGSSKVKKSSGNRAGRKR